MSCRKLSIGYKALDIFRQFQQSQAVGDVRATLAHALRYLILSQPVSIDHLIDTFGFFDRVQILTLHVFYNSKQHIFFIAQFSDNARDFLDSHLARCTPAAFPGNDLIPCSNAPQYYRLDQTVLSDRVCQILQLFFIKCLTRLIGVRLDIIDIHI